MMLLRTGGLLAAVVCSAAMPAATPLPATFQAALTEARMVFALPAGWKEVPVRPKTNMEYDYALRHPTRNVEVRYSIRPLSGAMQAYAEATRTGEVMVDPNQLTPNLLQSVLLNISGGQEASVGEFDAQDSRKEFGADWGAAGLVTPTAAFAPGYRYCTVVALHKDGQANAYCMYLATRKADLDAGMEAAFHCLRFR